jgi:glycosyltransferase involved in cell wall biosynthesis
LGSTDHGGLCYYTYFTPLESLFSYPNVRGAGPDLTPDAAFFTRSSIGSSRYCASCRGEYALALRTWWSLLAQRTRENSWVVDSALVLFAVWGFVQALAGKRGGAVKTLSQVHRTTRLPVMRRLVEGYVVANRGVLYQEPPPSETPNLKKYFGRRLLVLKPPLAGGEKGVLFVSFSDMFRLLYSFMDVEKLLHDYTFVFEPSYPGFCHPELLKYTRWSEEIFVLAGEEGDFDFLARLNSNLVPVQLGPADWVDPRIAEPYLGQPKQFDIVMNAGWMALKRHYVLFRMLANARRSYKTLLIGFGYPRTEIENLAAYYGVREQITIVEDVPYEVVMELTCRARVSVILSLKEAGPRATAESMFCGVPTIVLSNLIGGIRKNIVPATGLFAKELDLEAAIETLVHAELRPRMWALQHISCFKSSENLNTILQEHALRKGRPWTENLVCRSNSPDSTYAFAGDRERLNRWNDGLSAYLS